MPAGEPQHTTADLQSSADNVSLIPTTTPLQAIFVLSRIPMASQQLLISSKLPTHSIKSCLDRVLQQLQEWSAICLLDTYDLRVPDEFDVLDPFITYRQQQLKWWWDRFGYFGLHYFIYCIAIAEANSEIKEGFGLSRHKDPKSRPVVDDAYSDDEENENEQNSSSDDVQVPCSDDESSGDAATTGSPTTPEHDASTAPKGGHKSWTRYIHDFEKGPESRCLFYLLSMDRRVIDGLLAGDLPSMMAHDSHFADEVKPLTEPQTGPGTYAVFLAVNERHQKGRGLTLRQLITVVDKMKLYCSAGDPESAKLAEKVDKALGKLKRKTPLGYSKQRRYAGGSEHTDLRKHKHWIELLEDQLISKARQLIGTNEEYKLDAHMRRCFVYIGLSMNVLDRVFSHPGHARHVSPLYGLFTAIVEHLWPGKYGVKEHSFQILRTACKDDLGLDEILTTILCSGYFWDLGLSYVHAGSVSVQPSDRFAENALWIHRQGMQVTNLQDSLTKLDNMNALLREKTKMQERSTNLSTMHQQDLAKAKALMAKLDLIEALSRAQLLDTIVHFDRNY